MEKIERHIRYRRFLFKNFHFPRFLRKFERVVHNIILFFDPVPIFKKNETERNWLKRIPPKNAFRHSNHTYRQALALYKEMTLRDDMRNSKKLSKKENQKYKKYLHVSQLLFQEARELHEEVEIRARIVA